VLAGGTEGEAYAPAQPGGTGGEDVVPALTGIELADEVEQTGGGGVEVRGELGDLIANRSSVRISTASPPSCGRLYT
jgi:hypothetical protein